MAFHQYCEYNCGATDCDAPLRPNAKDQAQAELNYEEFREEIDKHKKKIIEDRNKLPWIDRYLLWLLGRKTVYKHFPEQMEVGVYHKEECLTIARWDATDERHKINVTIPVYRDAEYIMDYEITVDIRRPKS